MDEKGCPIEMKQELLAAIKQARDGSIPEYFDAMYDIILFLHNYHR